MGHRYNSSDGIGEDMYEHARNFFANHFENITMRCLANLKMDNTLLWFYGGTDLNEEEEKDLQLKCVLEGHRDVCYKFSTIKINFDTAENEPQLYAYFCGYGLRPLYQNISREEREDERKKANAREHFYPTDKDLIVIDEVLDRLKPKITEKCRELIKYHEGEKKAAMLLCLEDTQKTMEQFINQSSLNITVVNGQEQFIAAGTLNIVGSPAKIFKEMNGKHVRYVCVEETLPYGGKWKTTTNTYLFSPEHMKQEEHKIPKERCDEINTRIQRQVVERINADRKNIMERNEKQTEWQNITEEKRQLEERQAQERASIEAERARISEEKIRAEQAALLLEAQKNKIQQEEERLKREKEALDMIRDDRGMGEERKEPSKCIVCLEHAARYAVVPCGHVCLCQLCSRDVHSIRKCPMCRVWIEKVIRVFHI